jgi:di/tricarboxylate transporter
MTTPQAEILGILAITVGLFLWGRWRHDLVALASLMSCVLVGLISANDAFVGFGHPAVLTVACVLILSRGLQDTGAIDQLAAKVLPRDMGPVGGIAALTVLGALLSAFMNNVGAMALLLPLGLQLSDRYEVPAARILMPLAFGTILGGMTTLIGTPPNLIVSEFRAEAVGEGFGMFDFSPVGIAVALAGVLFLVVIGWRLVPARSKGVGTDEFETGTYLVEAVVGENSSSIGKPLRRAEITLEEEGAQIVGLIRDGTRLHAPNPQRHIRLADTLVIEADPEDLAKALSSLDLSVGEAPIPTADTESVAEQPESLSEAGDQPPTNEKRTEPVALQEYVVMPGSRLSGQSAGGVQMSARHGVSLLAVARQGQRSLRRLRAMPFKAGDLLLLQAPPESLGGFASEYNLVPLASRDIRVPQPRKAITAGAIMLLAIAIAAFGLLPAAAAFALGVLAMGVTGTIAPRDLYKAVDWPIVVLLAALIPVAGAMASTGTADLLADAMLNQLAQGSPVIAMGLLLVVTMTMSDFMNNAATAAVMCPIALSVAAQLGVNPDPMLMAVAIGASCAFLTPIGHQNNTLILGPGGLKFGDYWRLGLPMEIVVVAVSIPMLLLVWPL